MTKKKLTLEDILFPVELRPLFLGTGVGDPLAGVKKTVATGMQIPDYAAVFDARQERILAVVSSQYRLVPNAKAIELGKQCFQRLFGSEKTDEMELFNIIASQRRTFCHIDFLNHKQDFEPIPGDRWMPFLRITNSYNRTKPLSFDIGFCRAICTNGVIFRRASTVMKYYHTTEQINLNSFFPHTLDELKMLQEHFVSQIRNLFQIPVQPEDSLALACHAFQLKVSAADIRNRGNLDRLIEFRDHLQRLTNRYFGEIGHNAYAACNVLTDFASRPSFYLAPDSMVNSLQKRCGTWISEFNKATSKPEFKMHTYLGDALVIARELAELKAKMS